MVAAVAPCGRLYGELVGSIDGPILVIGGGPSVPGALEELRRDGFKPAAVISANLHGFLQSVYPVTHAYCSDPMHGVLKVRMEKLLRPHGAPIITPNYFGDYRLAEWHAPMNAGLCAIAVAVGMGGAPVVPIGIDFYRLADPRAGTYFHDPRATSNSNTKNERNFDAQLQALVHTLRPRERAPVRPLSGKLLEVFPRYGEPAKRFVPEFAAWHASIETVIVRAHPSRRWQFNQLDVDHGREIPMSPQEARGCIGARHAIEVRRYPAACNATASERTVRHATP